MDLPVGSMEEVDVPADLSVELRSSAEDLYVPLVKNKNHGTKVGVTSLQASSDCLSGSSSIESLNMLVEKQRKRRLNHPQHQQFIGERLRPQETVKETSEIYLKYDPISRRKVLNTYEIIGELGHGQHGKVKLARDLLTKQLVAIKIVDRHEKRERKLFRFRKSGSQAHSDKIKREIAIMKKCQYKHVVKLREVLDDSKSRKIYLVLEYCGKGEVKWCPGDRMETEARGPPLLSFQRTREILRGVVLGLEYLHFQGVIHRDIKPANLLISDDDTVKISDFGVSLAATGGDDEDGLDSVDEVELAKTAGTPAFFAPEICLGNEAFERFQLKRQDLFKGSSISFMIDIWALGVTLYCLLFGMLPFISSYELELFEKIVNDPVKYPSYAEVRANNVSEVSGEEEYKAAIDLLDALLQKNPMKRITITQIKKHPFTCWDFNHITSTEDDYIDSKLREIKEFQTDKQEQFKQISISRQELNNAVLGVGKKMIEPMLKKALNGRDGARSKSALSEGQKKNQEDYSDSSYILSEGSVMSNLGNLTDPQIDKLRENNSFAINGIHGRCSTLPTLKPRYSINNDNDNDNNGNDNEPNDKDSDKNNIETGQLSKSEFERELQKFDDKHDPKSMVDLPINSSFASLDSLYIDSFALSKHGKDSDADHPDVKTPSIHVRPPQLGALRNSSYVGRNNRGYPGVLRNPSSQLNLLSSSTRSDRVPHTRPQAISDRRKVANRQWVTNDTSCLQSSPHPEQRRPRGNDDDHFTATAIECKPATPNPWEARGDKESHSFRIKTGNFFSSFDGQDERTSTSSDSSTSEPSTYSSCSDGESDGSNAESLPFEFALDSANASVLSLRDVGGFETVRPFMHSQPATHRPACEKLGKSDSGNSGADSSEHSDSSDELVLSVGPSGFQRRQGSAQSSNNSSRKSTLPYLYPSSDATVTLKGDSTWTMSNASAPTILSQQSQRTLNMCTGPEVQTLDIPAHLSRPLNNLSAGNIAPSTSDHSGSPSSGVMQFTSTPSSSGSLLLSRASAKPTTQACNVDGVLSKVTPQEHPQDSSRDLLKTVLITAAGSNRRKSVPCIAMPENADGERLIKSSHDGNVPEEHLQKRFPRCAVRHRSDACPSRSQSISLGTLSKKHTK
ncbi:hypothetical protein HG536_0G04110 [Torulaspora globosa]|uniref:non-specific serine/threonine protein kinase n=1 Tax=Torulaspora globosa TaxID=48254 RepID=A0A7G3ZM13_9SACH|nr:uncharacterized protein HG536_0G04110 [Torulaspora globosa]QLL34549.1 hypothetical protein HG536_0G04110 [Torulaspora globosa]